jgi:hypothetical protein
MNRWICTEGDGYIIWGKGIHGEYVFAEMYGTIFDDFIQINENGIKKPHVSILLLYNNVCINFVMYKFCYRINIVPYKFCYV